MPKESLSRIAGLSGYGVWRWELDEERLELRLWIRQDGREPSYTCSGCGVERAKVHDQSERWIRDLRWGTWTVYLAVEVHLSELPSVRNQGGVAGVRGREAPAHGAVREGRRAGLRGCTAWLPSGSCRTRRSGASTSGLFYPGSGPEGGLRCGKWEWTSCSGVRVSA